MDLFKYKLYDLLGQSDELAAVARSLFECADGLQIVLDYLEPPLKDSEAVDLPLRKIAGSISALSERTTQYHRAIDEIVDIYNTSEYRVRSDFEETAVMASAALTGFAGVVFPSAIQSNALISEDWLTTLSFNDNEMRG